MRLADGSGDVHEARNECAWEQCHESLYQICVVWAVSPNNVVHDDSQYGNAAQQASFQILNTVGCSWHAWLLDHLILQYQTTSVGAISKASYTEHVPPILAFHLECRSALTDMVSYSKWHIETEVIYMNSHGHQMCIPVWIKLFHSALKCYIISKTCRCFQHINTHIRTYVCMYVHIYIHTYIHTYIHIRCIAS
jgi:hypothetical protein